MFGTAELGSCVYVSPLSLVNAMSSLIGCGFAFTLTMNHAQETRLIAALGLDILLWIIPVRKVFHTIVNLVEATKVVEMSLPSHLFYFLVSKILLALVTEL